MKNQLLFAYLLISSFSVTAQIVVDTLDTIYNEESADFFLNQAIAYQNQQLFKYAQDNAERARVIYLRTLPDSSKKLLRVYDVLAMNTFFLEDYITGMDRLKQVLHKRQQDFSSNDPEIARSYNLLGNTYFFYGDVEAARNYQEMAKKICEESVLPKEETELLVIYNNLAVTYEELEDFEKALFFLEKALEIAEGAQTISKVSYVTFYNNLGRLLTKLGKTEEGMAQFQLSDSLALDMVRKGVFGGRLLLRETYREKALLSVFQKNYGEAISNYLTYVQSLLDPELLKANIGPSQDELAAHFNNLGHIYYLDGQYGPARVNLLRAQGILESVGLTEFALYAQVLINLAAVYVEQGAYTKSLEYGQKGLDVLGIDREKFMKPRQNALPEAALIALQTLSKAYFLLYMENKEPENLQNASRINAAAREFLMEQVGKIHGQAGKQILAAQHRKVFEWGIRIALEGENDPQKAFSLAENSKHIQLKYALRLKNREMLDLPKEILDKERQLHADRSLWTRQVLEGRKGRVLDAEEALFRAEDSLRAFKNMLLEKYPSYFSMVYEVPSVNVQDVMTKTSPGESLISYFVGLEHAWVFALNQDTLVYVPLPHPSEVRKKVQDFQYGIQWLPTENVAPYNSYLSSAHSLYQMLWQPVEEHLRPKVRVVPDGPLGYLAFDALLNAPTNTSNPGELPYLVRTYAISFSATALEDQAMLNNTGRSRIALFNPGFLSDPVQSGENVTERIKAHYPTQVFQGKKALKQTFLEQAVRAPILFLYSHAFVDDDRPENAWIGFFEGDSSYQKLYLEEIYPLDMPADLVVLAACETGLGEVRNGEGILSLSRAFRYAGSQSLVHSLWQVKRDLTADLMGTFFTYLAEGMPKDEALRVAKLSFIDQNHRAAPFYWAGFVVQGDIAPLPPNRNRVPILLLVLLAFGLGTGLFFWIRRRA